MKKHITKKIASLAMAGAITLSSLPMLATTASAAQLYTGKIQIDLVDSSVYGGDRTIANMNTDMKVELGAAIDGKAPAPIFKEYWDNSFTNRDFLYTPQGLATFDQRMIYIYDITQENGTALTPATGSRFTFEYLEEVANAQGTPENPITKYAQHVGSYAIGRGGILIEGISDGYGYITDLATNTKRTWDDDGDKNTPPVEKLNLDWLVDDHHYVVIEYPGLSNSESGYDISVDGQNNNAWQVIFQWTNNADIKLSYDANVASESTLGIPLHNDVLRGNFTFNVYDKDLQKYASQNQANITGSKYAVYNISSTATSREDANEIAWKNDGTSTAGYVIADRDGDGVLSDVERTSYVPAYTEEEIINAYTRYLTACNTAKKFNGDSASATYMEDGEFIIGDNAAGKPIIPVMILEPDANGVVSTGTVGLPVGNYIIVQIQAGMGYYLDENFRPIVSIGLWRGTSDDEHSRMPAYGNAYWEEIANTYNGTINKLRSHSNLGAVRTNSPVAFCPAYMTTDLSTLKDDVYYINSVGNITLGGIPDEDIALGVTYTEESKGASNNMYIMNPDDERMKPVAGTNKFTVQNAVIRSDAYIDVADSDDLANPTAGLNLDANGNYVIVPQGNGNLNGAKFELIPYSKTNYVRLYKTGVTLAPGETYEYTVKNNELVIPTDDLPFGLYHIKPVSAGLGYEIGDWTLNMIGVTGENKTILAYSDQFDADGNFVENESPSVGQYSINEVVHLPYNLIQGGEVYSLNSETAAAGTTATVSVYNISNEYVYVDSDGDGTEERYETNQYTYKNQIAGSNLSHENLLKIISSWTPCRELELEVGKSVSFTDTLPYGTYLVAVTGVPAGFDVTGDYMTVDVITSETDNIEFETKIDNIAALPEIETWFTDAQTDIDSIAIKNRVFLKDLVKIENLIGGQDYTIYGAIIDKDTGDILQQGAVAYANGTAYKATNIGNSSGVNSRAAEVLLTDGARFIVWSDDYMAWVLEVKDYATTIGNQTLASYCDTAIRNGNNNGSNITNQFEEDKSRITATLKYLARGEASNVYDLDGTLEVTVNFDALDTRDMEGKTLVAYEYLCDSIGVPVKPALAAQSTGELLAALDNLLVSTHRDLNDENQTVRLSTLDIEAYASYTKSKTIDPSETIEGFVTYGNLEVGNKYVVEAWLVDAYGDKVYVKDENGQITTTLRDEFTAFAETSDSVFVFEGLDAVQYNNQRLTVYAALYRCENDKLNKPTDYWLIEKGDATSMGYTITDSEPGKNQVDIVAPIVKTVLADKYGKKTVNFDRKVSIVDTVTYKGLVVGGVYNSVLTLVDTEGAALYDDEGNELTAEVKFTATKEDMTIEIPLTFMGKDLRGLDIVAYNDLYRQTPDRIALVAQEHNPLATDQTITATGEALKITVSTVAVNPENNTHVIATTGSSPAVDKVVIRNLEPATQYIAKTELARASTGKTITQFMPIETVFTTDLEGTAKFEVPFTVNALVFKGEILVVYQTIYDITGETVIAVHDDMYDVNQMIKVPDIDTVATANDGISKKIVPTMTEVNMTNDPNGPKETKYYTEVMDTIYYKNLVPGNMYNITTEVVTRDGKASLGKTTSTFTALTENGTVTAYIDLDVTSYRDKQLVVYETITDAYSGKEVVIHADLSDLDQTVEILGDIPDDEEDDEEEDDPRPDDPSNPNVPTDPTDNKPSDPSDPDDLTPGKGTDIDTGVDEQYGLFFAIGAGVLLAAGGLVALLIYRRKKNEQ